MPSVHLIYFCGSMQRIPFSKYQGTGNDFVVVDNRDQRFPTENLTVVRQMCDRKFGIGSDGLILIEPDDQTDFYMNFFNPDGSQSYCGNGSRCAVHFARANDLIGDSCTFRAIDGEHRGMVKPDEIMISIRPVAEAEPRGDDFLIHTGSPHYVVFCTDVDEIDILPAARNIRYNTEFKENGVNVNFVEVLDEKNIRIRTYERGVEDETLSCGTGVTAAAITHLMREGSGRKVHVETRGGTLDVSATKGGDKLFFDVWLTGPAVETFTGTYHCELC